MTSSATHPEKEVLDWKIISEPFDQILEALENKIEREWPKELSSYAGAQEVVSFTLKVAKNTYQTIDKPHYEDRKLEFSVSVPLLTRTFVDHLFTLIFLSEDILARSRWYYKSGWRELKEEYDRYQSKYASDPKWTPWLKSFQQKLHASKISWGIDEFEEKDFKKIKWWPTPPQMLKHSYKNPETKQFLEFLNDWFYKELSSVSHLTLPGLSKAGVQLVRNQYNKEEKEKLLTFKSNNVITTLVLFLALASEIEIIGKFDLRNRLSYLWGILVQYFSDARDLYDLRYAKLLQVKN